MSDEIVCNACGTATKQLKSLRTQLTEANRRVEELLDLMDEAELSVWETCGCSPKKSPDWDGGSWWREVGYEIRKPWRSTRCAWHKQYDEFLEALKPTNPEPSCPKCHGTGRMEWRDSGLIKKMPCDCGAGE